MKTAVNTGISEKNWTNILSVFAKNQRVKKVILFGSRAKGNFAPGSDIDIALKGNGIELTDIIFLKVELDDLNLPYLFDVLIYTDIKEPALKAHIDRTGIELFYR